MPEVSDRANKGSFSTTSRLKERGPFARDSVAGDAPREGLRLVGDCFDQELALVRPSCLG